MSATAHFIARVRERVGPHVDPIEIADGIIWAIQSGRDDLVEYVGRVSRDGKRLFRFRVPDGRYFYALVSTAHSRCVTILPPGYRVQREGKGAIYLREDEV